MNLRTIVRRAAALGLYCLAPGIGAAERNAQTRGVDEAAAAAIKERFQASGMELEIRGIAPSPIPGLKEVEVADDGVMESYMYVTDDGRFLLAGSLYELREGGVVGITEQRRNAKRLGALAEVTLADMLVYSPEDEVRAAVTVFTDPDCGYCRRLHANMADYHAHGIEVRYLAYPRAGVDSSTYEDMVSAWCANDPLEALTSLKRGDEIPNKSCVNPVAEQYELGQRIGIAGTPAIVLPDGRLVPGLVDAEQLAARLGI